jgi:uncharacterized protein (DUF4415 family)
MTDEELAAIGYTSMTMEESRAHAKTPAFRESMKRLGAIRDKDIDYSEVAPISNRRLAEMVRANQYRPVKRTVTLRVDADILEWLKSKGGGAGYQTRLNAMLRRLMLGEAKS